MTQCNG